MQFLLRAIVAIVRDHLGRIMAGFVRVSPALSPLAAELSAICEGSSRVKLRQTTIEASGLQTRARLENPEGEYDLRSTVRPSPGNGPPAFDPSPQHRTPLGGGLSNWRWMVGRETSTASTVLRLLRPPIELHEV